MLQILQLLESDARLTPERIAALTGVDVAGVREQIAAWEQDGTIRRYKTVIDWERAGVEKVWALIDVSVAPERGAGFDDIASRIYRFPEVRTVMLISGGHDLRVTVEGDTMHEVANFVSRKLATLDRVTATHTHFLLKRYKDDGDVFAGEEPDHRLVVAP
jgi:DNA-binding Lrp family transcriptional regulator